MTTRTALIITHSYPPGLRVARLTRHMAEAGWRTIFLVPRRSGLGAYPSTAEGTSAVHRSLAPRTVSRWILDRSSRQDEGRANAGATGAAPGVRSGFLSNLVRRGLLSMDTPDDLSGWVPSAVLRGHRIIRNTTVDAIFASGPPFTAVLIGALLKRLSGTPFVADFRDAWVQDRSDPFGAIGGTFQAPYGRGRIAVLSAMERFSIERADLVLFTSNSTSDTYSHVYPGLARRFVVAYNGVEEADFEAAPPALSRFTLTYAGTLHPFQLPQAEFFMRAFAAAATDDAIVQRAEIRFTGYRSPRVEGALTRLAAELGISQQLVQLGPVRQQDAVALMRSSGALLLFAGGNRITRFGKISPCLAARRPILAFAAADSETARHVSAAGHRIYSGHSIDEAAAIIKDLVGCHCHDDLSHQPFPFAYPHPLNWRTSGERVATALDRLCAAGAASRRSNLDLAKGSKR